ncbi:hypothetical protein DIS24_g10201 [Lasiodiplodia hormozganensis]|uniref:Cyclochlorotine biosynthesis protein R n=1 Tax=Lasiodiplodia hormozganensis TaxID=869390 RepID=A0AA39XQ43_9PEZI|nr:hypothetical protein DIS24_g10201 [Lasiodiplodia hormozganensis]
MAAEKHIQLPTVLDEKRMEEARCCQPAAEYPTPALSTHSFQHVLIFALFCSNIFFASLAVFFYTNAQCPVVPRRLDPFSISASSRDARAHIRYEQRNFTGALKYNTTAGELYRVAAINSSEPSYVGDPRTTSGLDRAWKNLLSGSKFPLSNEEATPYLHASQPTTKSPVVGTLYGELSVFHNLECLNAIRLALDDDFYREHGPQDGLGWQKATRSDRASLDHCIDHLRQELQCSADLTVVPVLPRTTTTTTELAVQPRTCRRWDDVRSWLDRRHERSRFSSHRQDQQTYAGA